MMSPSFYRTIHKQPQNRANSWQLQIVHGVKQHAAKIIVSFAVFVLLFTSFLMMRTDASESHPAAAAAQEEVITVQTGDTLWEIAKSYVGSGEDIRYIIYVIRDRNGLKTADIKPGQQLIIPQL